jgi:TonB family protein
MRRLLLAALALACAAAAAGAEPALPPVDARPLPYTDAVPAGPSVEERLAEIARRVQGVSRYPAIARERGASGEALVAFEIGPGGAPRGLELVQTSGSGALDRAALRAVAEAAPLPFVHGRIQVPVRFALDTEE